MSPSFPHPHSGRPGHPSPSGIGAKTALQSSALAQPLESECYSALKGETYAALNFKLGHIMVVFFEAA